MARSAGVEPTTDCLEGSCSIQLSYERARKGTYLQKAGKETQIFGQPDSIMGARLCEPQHVIMGEGVDIEMHP